MSNDFKSNAKPRLLIIQPLLPQYRYGFFSRLSKKFNLFIYSSSLFVDDHRLKKFHTFTPNLSLLDLFFFQAKLPFWSSSNFDLVLLNFNPRYISTLILCIIFRISGKTIIDYNHRKSSSSSSLGFAIRVFLGNILGLKKIYYTNREYIRSLVNAEIPKNAALGFLNNTIDTSMVFENAAPYVPSLRSDFVFLGRVTEKSSFEVLVQALALSELDYKIHVVGDGPLLRSSTDLADCLNVKHRLVFHGDLFDEFEISKICNKCKCFVYPGDVGLSCIHLMSYGLPGVLHEDYTKHMPEFSSILDSGINFSFPRQSSSALAIAMDSLYLSRDDFLMQVSDRYKLTIKKEYTIDMMANRFSDLLDHL